MSGPMDDNFGHGEFPPHADPSNEETGMAELYPEKMQDQVNEVYGHDKVLPRVGGTDYTESGKNYDNAESKSSFPYKY